MILNNFIYILILGQYMFEVYFWSYILCFVFFQVKENQGFIFEKIMCIVLVFLVVFEIFIKSVLQVVKIIGYFGVMMMIFFFIFYFWRVFLNSDDFDYDNVLICNCGMVIEFVKKLMFVNEVSLIIQKVDIVLKEEVCKF